MINETENANEYLGSSYCRLCDLNFNGNKELKLIKDNITFTFPEGLIHYYIQHNVEPSNEFKEFILNY
jgi:hypothetical protein